MLVGLNKKLSVFFSLLQVQLTLLVLLLLFPALLLALMTTTEQNQITVNNTYQQVLLLARLTAANYEQLVVGTERVLIALSQLPEIQEGNTSACNALFVRLRQQYASYTNFYMVDTAGDTICTGLPDAAPINVTDLEWFQQAQMTEGFSIGDYSIGAVTGRPIITFSYPIYDVTGERLYYLGVGLDLEWMNEFIHASDLPPSTTISVIDRTGRILYRFPSDEGIIGQQHPNNFLISEVVNQQSGTLLTQGIENASRIYGFAPLDVNASAFVVVGVSEGVILAQSYTVLLRNLFGLMIVGALTLVFGLIITSRILVQPVQRLVSATVRFARGDLEARVDARTLSGSREIKELGLAFNTMVQSLQEAQEGLEGKVRERTRELTILTEASTTLASSLDYEETLKSVARLLVPDLADWCAIDLVGAENQLQRLITAHKDPAKAAWGEELSRRYPADPDSPSGGVYDVIKNKQAVIYPEITDAMLQAAARDSQHLQLLRQIGFVSSMTVPLIAREKTLGAMTLVSATTGHHYDENDLNLAKEMAQRIATNLDNAYLYRELDQQRQQLQVTLSSIGDAVIATDISGSLIFINTVGQQLTGWNERDAIGKPLNVVFRIVSESTHLPIESPFEKVVHEGKIVGLANHTLLINRHGREIPIDDSGAPIFDQNGILIGVILVFRDITERRQNEQRLNLLLELTTAFSKAVTSYEIADIIVNRGLSALNAKVGTVSLLVEDGKTLEIINRHGISEESFQRYRRTPLDFSGPLNDAVRKNKLIWIASLEEYVARYPHFEQAIRQNGSRATVSVPLSISNRVIGGFAFSFATEKVHTPSEEAFFDALAYQCAQALERAQLYEAEQRARQVAEEAQQRLTFLSEASGILSASLETQTTLHQITQLIVPRWADWTHIDLLENDHTIRRIAVRHIDPTLEAGLYELNRLYPIDLNALSGAGKVIRTNTVEFMSSIPEGLLEQYAQSPHHLELVKMFNVRSFVIVPLSIHGKTFGAMTFASQTTGFFDADDVPLLEEFGRRAALSIANAQLYETEQQSRATADAALQRVNRLQAATAALSEAMTLTQVSTVMVEQVAQTVDASSVLLARWMEKSRTFETLAGLGYDEDDPQVQAEQTALLQVQLEKREVRWYEGWSPVVDGQAVPQNRERWGILPLYVQAQPFGVLLVSLNINRQLDAPQQTLLNTLAQQSEQALERALLYEQSREVAALQERQRLARDLHDAVSQVLFSSTSIAEIVPRTWQRSPEKAFDQLAQVVTLNRAAMAEMRSLLLELRPENILRTNLALLIEQLLRAVKGRKTIETRFTNEGREETLPPEVHVAFYRIAQETITNVVKHSQATELVVNLNFSTKQIALIIQDNGLGFDTTQSTAGLGLQSMRERAAAAQIELKLYSEVNAGTQVSLIYPLKNAKID